MAQSKKTPPNTIGKTGQAKMPIGPTLTFTVIDEIQHRQSTDPDNKALYLQKLEFEDGHIEIRFCYYIVGELPRMRGRWVYGQFAPIMPAEDFQAIMGEAIERGWISNYG